MIVQKKFFTILLVAVSVILLSFASVAFTSDGLEVQENVAAEENVQENAQVKEQIQTRTQECEEPCESECDPQQKRIQENRNMQEEKQNLQGGKNQTGNGRNMFNFSK